MLSKLAITLSIVAVAALTLTLILLAVKQEQTQEAERIEATERIGQDVVATFVGGEVTAGELRRYINQIIPRSHTHQQQACGKHGLNHALCSPDEPCEQQEPAGCHARCDKHGYDHSKCTPDEECESHPFNSIDSYRTLLKQFILEKMVSRWIREKGLASRKDVKHRLKHLVEEINLNALAGEMHADKLKPDRVEMRQYYEQHKEEYKNRPFNKVEKEIERVLIAQKQAEYIPKYIEELKANAVIDRNYDLLKIPEPTEAEIRAYYEAHRKEYVQPEFVRIQTLRISANDEKAGREKAEKAMIKLRAGEDFSKAAREFADGRIASTEIIERGQRSRSFENRVFRYYPGEITPIFRDGNFFYIVKVLEREGKTSKPLPEVIGDVRAAFRRQKEQEKFKLNKYEALFSIHGKRFTVEEFQQEFSELTPEQQKQFSHFEAKKNLLDQLIIKELLMEKAEDKGVEAERRKEIAELKMRALQQMLHREEVDEKIQITEPQARQFYEKRKQDLLEPAKAKVDVIRIGIGFSEDERKLARRKIEQAQEKLRAGGDFAGVAREYSEDWTATRGGEMDRWIYEGGSHLGELVEHGFHRYVFDLDEGQISDFFEFTNNYWIVKMRRHHPSRQQTFEEAQPTIEAYLKAMKHSDRMLEMQNELVEKSQLVIRDFVLSRMLQAESKRHENERMLY